jgi:hypothetical protein
MRDDKRVCSRIFGGQPLPVASRTSTGMSSTSAWQTIAHRETIQRLVDYRLPGVPDQLSPGLEQPPLETRERPILNRGGQHRPT